MSRFVSSGRWRPGSAFRAGAGVAAVALAAAACGSSGNTSAAAGQAKSPMPEMSSSMPMPSPSMSMGSGMPPMGGGLVGARHLANRGCQVQVVLSEPARLTPVPAHQADILGRMGIHIAQQPPPADLVIDALIGYSLRGDPAGAAAELIAWANDQPAPVLALDTPSGLDLTTGAPGNPAIQATAGYWFWGRPSFYDLWHDLREATNEIRPDRDLSTPGLRETWNAGDYSPFHGWGKRSGEPRRHAARPMEPR